MDNTIALDLAFTPDSKRILAVGESYAKVFDIDFNMVKDLSGHTDEVVWAGRSICG